MADERRPRVAVVDDDDGVRESLRFLFETAGYDVVDFESAEAALIDGAIAEACCLVLDQHMPRLTGLELVGMLRARGVSLPIAIMTGSPSPELMREAMRAGVAQVLEKPLADDALLTFVERAANRASG